MEIHYEVTRSDYIKLIRQQLKNYNKSFKGRLVFFLTNGTFAAAAAYLFLMKHNETGFSKILPVILAVTIWIMNIHRRYSYNRRAEILFEKLIQNGLLIKEYLGEHQDVYKRQGYPFLSEVKTSLPKLENKYTRSMPLSAVLISAKDFIIRVFR